MNQQTLHHFTQNLISQGLLTSAQAAAASQQAEQKKQSLIMYLAENQIVSNPALSKIIAEHFQLPLLDLKDFSPENIPTKIVDEKFIKKNFLLPLATEQQTLKIAILDPSNTQAIAELKFHTGMMIQPVIADYLQLSQLIERVISKKQYADIKELKEIPNHTNQDDAPIIRFVQQIFMDAIQKSASDVHFEPYENFYRIRMRVDGILYEMIKPPIALAHRIAARLKVMAKLDISEKRLPQDGRFTLTNDKSSRECRISTCPTLYGEKIVVRILDNNDLILTIDHLGFAEEQKNIFLTAIQQPQGMILVTGPTGSGKTVTLYTALNLLNTLDQNISTVEDPVEINLAGINQVHVNPKIGLTFSQTLRAFLRQDPDIIMVGEIRDLETAEIAIKSAQTGHLVLSTVHTNSASETLTRLINMGVAPFNLAAAIRLIIAQRLVRKLCPHCKQTQKIPASTLLQQGFIEEEINELEIFTAGECQHCIKGYKGRIGIYEMLPINESIAQMIMLGSNTMEINMAARKIGLTSLHRAALNKVKQGITSLAEINRIISQS